MLFAPLVRQRRSLSQWWSDTKTWQAVLLDWQSGLPMVVGDPVSRHWTRWGARRAADWHNLRVLPMEVSARLRYAVMPTRHPQAN
jgi:hypothetical protein